MHPSDHMSMLAKFKGRDIFYVCYQSFSYFILYRWINVSCSLTQTGFRVISLSIYTQNGWTESFTKHGTNSQDIAWKSCTIYPME